MNRTRKYKILQIFTLILACAAVSPKWHANAQTKSSLTVVAAADLEPVMREIATQFELESGARVELVFGSSGNLATQIINGAPFDVFLSADRSHAEDVVRAAKAAKDSEKIYAIGRLVAWVPANSKLNFESRGLAALLDAPKISIANPQHAPYGRAAVAALQHFGLYDKLRDRIVLGENVSQAAQFASTGNAQAALIAMSLAHSPNLRNGRYWVVPLDSYPPLEQVMVIVGSSSHRALAQRFADYIASPSARAVFSRYGFVLPEKHP